MTRQFTPRTKAGVFVCFAFVTLALAGCGNHDQAGASGGSGTMTPAQIEQNAQKQNQPTKSPTAGATPAAPATH